MRVMSYNTLFGGFDGNDGRRHDAILGIIREADPDVLLVQELKGFGAGGSKLLYDMERRLGMRGFMAEARVTGQNTGIFVRASVEPVSFESDAEHFHHAAAIGRFRVPGLEKPVTAVSVHLCPNSTHVRLREASYLFNYADPDDNVLVAGDFNSVSPDDAEPEGLDTLPKRFSARYVGLDGRADRRTVASLLQAGFIDVAVSLAANGTPTVPGAAFKGTEFVPFRSDYVLATDALASRATSYSVIRNERTHGASDHYPIVADFQTGA